MNQLLIETFQFHSQWSGPLVDQPMRMNHANKYSISEKIRVFELTQAQSNMYRHRYGILGSHRPKFAEDRPICQLSHVVREYHGLHPNNRTLFLQLHYQC